MKAYVEVWLDGGYGGVMGSGPHAIEVTRREYLALKWYAVLGGFSWRRNWPKWQRRLQELLRQSHPQFCWWPIGIASITLGVREHLPQPNTNVTGEKR